MINAMGLFGLRKKQPLCHLNETVREGSLEKKVSKLGCEILRNESGRVERKKKSK